MLIFLTVTILMTSGQLVSYEVRDGAWTLEQCETMKLTLGSFMYTLGPQVWTNYTAVCTVYPPAGDFVKLAA